MVSELVWRSPSPLKEFLRCFHLNFCLLSPFNLIKEKGNQIPGHPTIRQSDEGTEVKVLPPGAQGDRQNNTHE